MMAAGAARRVAYLTKNVETVARSNALRVAMARVQDRHCDVSKRGHGLSPSNRHSQKENTRRRARMERSEPAECRRQRSAGDLLDHAETHRAGQARCGQAMTGRL